MKEFKITYRNPIKRCFLLLLCLLINYNLYAEPEKNDSLVLNDKNWNEIKKDIDYTETYKEFKQKEPIDFDLSKNFFNNTWVQVITALIIISILCFLIIKLVNGNTFRLNRRIANNTNYEVFDDNPDINEIDLDKMLEIVLKKQDYKLAIRIRFLMVIKQLNESEYIKWGKDKTNGEYISDMYEREELPDFIYLVMIFERIWYGDKLPNINDYSILSKHFNIFLQKIHVK